MRPLLALALLAAPQADESALRLLDRIERKHRATPDPADPRTAAARLGFDRAKIAEFVGGLSWEPYEGVLRDAAGTLLCGGGNSIDRALLLQAMLEAAGEKTRLVRADLAEADGARFRECFRKRERKERPGSGTETLAAEFGLDPAALGAELALRRSAEAAFVEEIAAAAKAESARLAAMVGALADRPASAPREHVWVQVADRAGWTDVDPSPVEVPRQGARPLTAQELVVRRRGVTIRLVLHRKGSAPTPILNVPSDLPALSWKSVTLLLLPVPGEVPPLAGLDEKARVEAFRKARKFRGALLADGRHHGSVPFDLSGRLYEVDAGGRVGPARALGKGLGQAFGGAFGGGGEEAAAQLVDRLVLEVALREPGGVERVHRRTLYEPGKSDGLPVLRYSFLLDAAPLPAGERARREVAALAQNAPALRRILRGEGQGARLSEPSGPPSLLLAFADLRRRLLLGVGEGRPVVQDRPGLVAETSQVCLGERLSVRRGIDLFDNPARFESAGPTLALGAADTALECLLLARRTGERTDRSAWTLMERARLRGGKPEVRERDGRRELRWSDDAWWSVDPADGTCVGRVPSGAGQGLVESAIEHANSVCTYADIVGFVAESGKSAGVTPEAVGDTADWMGKACGALGGTTARDLMNDRIKDVNKNLWGATLDALMGM